MFSLFTTMLLFSFIYCTRNIQEIFARCTTQEVVLKIAYYLLYVILFVNVFTATPHCTVRIVGNRIASFENAHHTRTVY